MSHVALVGELATQVRGVSYNKRDVSNFPRPNTVGVVRAGNISNGELVAGDLVYVPESKVNRKQLLRKGDVLIATSSGSIDVVGKAARIREDQAVAFGAFCKVLRPSSRVDAGYFAHYFLTTKYRHYVSAVAAGANINNLKNSHLDEIEIPLPPIGEQRRIAAVLDAADVLRDKRRQSIAHIDSLMPATFIDLFGHPISNPRGWPLAKLSMLGRLDRGVSRHRPRNDPALLGGDWPLIQTGDVAGSDGYIADHRSTYSDLGLAQSKLWPAGTLCITIAANIARTGILSFDACFPDSVVGFTAIDRATTEYVRVFLNFLQPSLEQQAPESAQKNINLKILRELQVQVPPAKLRAKFAQMVGQANAVRDRSVNHELRLDTLFEALQQRAFRGEL